MKTRTYLYLMAAAILIPVALAFWIGVSMLLDWERESRIHRVQETARSTALLVDREIAVKEALLRVIANSEALGEQNFQRVYRLATRLNGDDRMSWTTLVDERYQPIFNTLTPFGTALKGETRHYVDEVLRTEKTRVSGYFYGPTSKRAVVSVDVASPPGQGPRYVVSQIFDARYFERVFANSTLEPTWLVGIFDAKGVTIARNRHGAASAGKPMHPDMRTAALHAGSGVLRHVTHEGTEVYGIYTRAATSGWTIVIGVPVAEIEAAARTAATYATLALILLMGRPCSSVTSCRTPCSRPAASPMGWRAARSPGRARPRWTRSTPCSTACTTPARPCRARARRARRCSTSASSSW